ncbi:hypothetical protein [Luteimonas kalidii]|uniref:Tetratricopeptide repeat protein n=1 Tax=Luteimonas kalidii TaxID=3042025 RepID=A0ABT6JWY8_9GAMM|nr:hypothetical protein [Luteimonas kalidii]MDH5835094.1 hypothetical protein [Luteimonas kalidii]
MTHNAGRRMSAKELPVKHNTVVLTIVLLIIALGWTVLSALQDGANIETHVVAAEPAPSMARDAHGQPQGAIEARASGSQAPPRVTSALRTNLDLLDDDPRLIALSIEELEWMGRHYYPTPEELASLDRLDLERLAGTSDPGLQTLQGLALIQRGDIAGALSVLQNAATRGSIYAYQEAAVAQHALLAERLGRSHEIDAALRAQLEVSRILGDHRAGHLMARHLPDFDPAAHAALVQQYTTEFLRQLGSNAQALGTNAAGPDPRPNLAQWNDLIRLADAGESVSVEVYSAGGQ